MKQIISPNFVHENTGWCLRFTDRSFGLSTVDKNGNTIKVHQDMAIYPSAYDAGLATKYKHYDRNFPQGVSFPVWFEWWGDLNNGLGYRRYDHVAIYHSDGRVYSAPLSGNGYAWFESIDDLVRSFGGGMKYLFWSEDVSNVRVIEEEDSMELKTNGQIDAIILNTYGRHAKAHEYAEYRGKNWHEVLDKLRETADFKARDRAAKGFMDSNGQVDAVFLNSFGRHVKPDELKKYKGKNWHKTLDEIRTTKAFKDHHETAKGVSPEFEEVTDKLYRRK